MIFRHFKTLKEARAYIAENSRWDGQLVYRKKKPKKKGVHEKPYKVGTPLSFLHFD